MRLIARHIAFANESGAVIADGKMAYSIGDEYVCSETSRGVLFSEYHAGSELIVHTWNP